MSDETSPLLRKDLDSLSTILADVDDLAKLPQVIVETVPLVDDPSEPVLTVRFFILAVVLIIPGAVIDTLNAYRTTSAPYSIFFVQIVAHWAGKWLAKTLPKQNIRVLGHSVCLNPGPWSIKETALVTIAAKSGATGNLATNAISMAELHFHQHIDAKYALGFMWAIVFIGYSYAIIAKDFVLYNPEYTWPQSLMQTTLLQLQKRSDETKSPMRLFFFALAAMALWQLLPEYVFPLTSSLAVLCWMAPRNHVLNFIGSGMGGMGVLNFSLDWANITSSIMLNPYWIQVIQFVAFVFGAWVLIPLAKWLGWWFSDGLMSNKLFLANGTVYPTDQLLTPNYQLNLTAYTELGPVHLGAQRAWNIFFDYAAYVSGIVWIVLFGYKQLIRSFGKQSRLQYQDRLNKLHAAYAEVPNHWYYTLLGLSLSILALLYTRDMLFMPWWCCLAGLGTGAVIVTPLIYLYAISNFQMPIGVFNEMTYGLMTEHLPQKHAIGAAFYGSISGNAWYRAQYHLESMKLGFYNHLPPRYVFFAQIFGELIGVPFNYLALRWVLRTKSDYVSGTRVDPLHQWTGQAITTLHTNAIQYAVLGPTRLFLNYPWLPYGFLVGLVAPTTIFLLHRRYPSLQYWNTTVFFSTMSHFYGNISTGYLSKFIGGTITMFYAFRYHHNVWKRYNYTLAAAFDTGLNLSILVVFVLFSLNINMPHWWGNDERSVERCFAL